MADLLMNVGIPSDGPPIVRVSLWCSPCGTTHDLDLPDVERVLYALGLMLPVGESQLGHGGENFPHPECLLHVLKLANSDGWYLRAVAEFVAAREQAVPAHG